MTLYKDITQLPAFEDYAMKGRTYRYFDGKPVYAFGYGLSYTRFSYGPVSVKPRGNSTSDGLVLETQVTNVGARAGDEVAQVYLTFPNAPGTPKIALRGFQRLSLARGEKRRVTFELSQRDLSTVSPEGKIQVLAGRYLVHVGGSQPGDGLPGQSGTFAIKAASILAN